MDDYDTSKYHKLMFVNSMVSTMTKEMKKPPKSVSSKKTEVQVDKTIVDIENFHFYFCSKITDELIKDQSLEKNPNLKVIV